MHPQFASQRAFVTRFPQFAQRSGGSAIHSRLGQWRVKLRQRTCPQHVKAYFPNCLTRFARDPATLRIRTGLAQRSAAPDQNSFRFPPSERGLPLSPRRSKFGREESREAAQVAEAPVATCPAI